MGNLEKDFFKILNEYLSEKNNVFKDNNIANFLRKDIVQKIAIEAKINLEKYKIQGSPGQGKWADVPWVCIFDKGITVSAQKGYFLVYLFKEDMSGFYLSLNQGWTQYKEKDGKKQGIINIRKIRNKLREEIRSDFTEYNLNEISLGSGDLAQGYESGHILGKYYDAAKLPSDIELIDDLREMLGIYKELKGLLNNQTFEEMCFKYLNDEELYLDEEDYIQAIEETNYADDIPEAPQDKRPPMLSSKGKRTWPRNPKIAKKALEKANYLCEIDGKHITFISNASKKNYMEPHHIIPMNEQDNFEKSLDVVGNLISCCPTCHRKIHYAEKAVRDKIIEKIYAERKGILEKYGLFITLEELKKTMKHWSKK